MKKLIALLVIVATGLTGCVFKEPSRYPQKHDSAPSVRRDLAKIPDAVPKVEPLSRGGNASPYTVNGKSYHVLPASFGYQQTGTASWYGAKFHGHKTSNGETYNMFALSAAHKSLPLPTYVRVTNLNNGRQVIVRVNDRGPFHGDRLIDLSYTAAVKLGYADKGTARVRVEAIDPIAWNKGIYSPSGPASLYVQVAAFSSHEAAQGLKQQLQDLVNEPVVIYRDTSKDPALHKVHIGPLADRVSAERVRAVLNHQRFGKPIIVVLPAA